MCKRIVKHAEDWPAIKLHRWLGFRQAGMIAKSHAGPDRAKAMFNKVKGEYGPLANDHGLLDHLDPTQSFEVGGQG
jgi:hypothetical protein